MDLFETHVTEHAASLSPACRKVAHYMNSQRAAVLARSAAELAEKTGTSDASVI